MANQKKSRRSAGNLESEILAALWAADGPLTPGQTVEALGDELAYTTVQTTLTRLVAKGVVRRESAGRAFVYAPVLDQAGVVASRMRAILESGADDLAVLSRFVGSLSPEQERALVRLLEERRES